MARSPDYVRLATNAARSLADTAFDSLPLAALVVDSRPNRLPIILANAAARGCLAGHSEQSPLLDGSLYGLLEPASASAVEPILASLSDGESSIQRTLSWRLTRGECTVKTEFKLLDGAPGQRLVMLTFAPMEAERDIVGAVEQLPFNMVILDRQLNVTYANTGAERSSGRTGGLRGISALTLAPISAVPHEVYLRALEGCHYHEDGLELSAPGTPVRCFEIDMEPLRSPSGIVGLIVLSTETGERPLLRSPRTRRERRLRELADDNAQDIITVAAPDGGLQYVSGGVKGALGYTPEELRSIHLFDHVHADDAQSLRAKYQRLTTSQIDRFSHQHRVRRKDGTYRWLESNYVAAFDDPLIYGVVINSRDITERKEAESRLAQREEIFRLAAEAVDGVIFEWDLTQGIVHRSRGVLEILGIEPEDLAPDIDAWCERIHPNDFSVYRKEIGLALVNGRGWTTTYRIRDSRGRYRSMLERGLIQRNATGDPVRAIGCCVDVSEIKRLTDLLAETQRTANMGGWEYSYSARELTWTEEMFRIYETSPAEFVVSRDSVLEYCSPASRQSFVDAIGRAESASADEQFDLELEITTLKNRQIWVRMIGHVEKLNGRPFRAFGSVQNIQAQKLAQFALENSTDWLKLSMSMAHMHAWRWDKAKDEFEFAIVDGQAVNLPTEFPGMKELMARIHPKDRMSCRRAIEQAFKTHRDMHQEFRLKANDGRYRTYTATVRPVFDAAGSPRGLVGVTQDVTPWRESEAQMRRSEQLLHTTTSNAADTLMLVDTALCIRFINKSSRGMTIEQIVGRDIAAILPEAACTFVIAKLRQVLATEETATYEFESKEGDSDEVQFFENRAVFVRDDNIGTGISISVRNITERKRLEQEILDVSTRERQTIGRDLHDGLGQELTGVALMLRGLATRIQHQSPETVVQVNEIVGLVNQSIESARSLARGLLPVHTDSGGLPFALRTLAARTRDLYGLEVNFRAEVWPELSLSEASASHLYRIAQEALTNAARHGHASKVEIFLLVTRNAFFLRITDDGTGVGGAHASATGMGLKIMRYRAGMIGAKFEIGPNIPHGTVVRVTGDQPVTAGALHPAHVTYGGHDYGR
jgi:PAS domain S-box-containing protein